MWDQFWRALDEARRMLVSKPLSGHWVVNYASWWYRRLSNDTYRVRDCSIQSGMIPQVCCLFILSIEAGRTLQEAERLRIGEAVTIASFSTCPEKLANISAPVTLNRFEVWSVHPACFNYIYQQKIYEEHSLWLKYFKTPKSEIPHWGWTIYVHKYRPSLPITSLKRAFDASLQELFRPGLTFGFWVLSDAKGVR